MTVIRQTLEEFNKFSGDFHHECFKENRPAWANTFDFALLAEDDETKEILGYITCFEIDAGQVWVHFGGVFQENKKIPGTQVFQLGINYLRERYARIVLDTKNTNIAMIKVAYASDFVIVGVDCSFKEIYLRLLWEQNE